MDGVRDKLGDDAMRKGCALSARAGSERKKT